MENTKIIISNDVEFNMATAHTRFDPTWKNSRIKWSDFLTSISGTRKTGETTKEFIAMKKSQQDGIKDVGGFFGGYLVGGKRSNATVQHRQLITLDIDEGKSEMWESFKSEYNNAAAMYTTHKHTPKAPRFRLLVPLVGEVTAEQYEAIARWIAGSIGIDMFDDTTFQAARFMYMPSTSKDGEYLFKYQDGPIMDGSNVLNSYTNWADSSEWPFSSRQPIARKHEVSEQGDPTEKPYPIGAFCRAYPIDEAIREFLGDVYRSDGHSRYTYANGSTSKGLVVYDGMFAYSNHSTDPACGKLCNAFDLVRIHKFGNMDGGSKEYQKPSDMPSYKEMENLCADDNQIRRAIATQRAAEVAEDFGGIEIESTTELLSELDHDKKGNFLSTLKNFRRIVAGDNRLNGIKYDIFASHITVTKPLPWDRTDLTYPRGWTDTDDAWLRNYLADEPYCLNPKSQDVRDAFDAVIKAQRCFHPVRDYINSCIWDGTHRLDTLFIDYFGAENTALNRAITRKAFTACIARVFHPGCKYDNVLVVIGGEGIGKSSLFRKMGGEWFSDSITSIEGRDGMEQLQGKWLIELAELSALKKAEVEAIKSFISKTDDSYRAAYGRRNERRERQCVFFATTNVSNFLRGYNGNRRFWPIVTGVRKPQKDFFGEFSYDIVEQLWAEAKFYYGKKEPLFLPKALEEEARRLQDDHNEDEDLKSQVYGFLDMRIPSNWDTMNKRQKQEYFRFQDDETQATGIYERNRITSTEIINECLFERAGTPQAAVLSRKIAGLMSRNEAWRRMEKKQRIPSYDCGATITFERIRNKSNEEM